MLVNIAGGMDLSQPSDYVMLELLKRLLYFGLLVLAYAVTTLRSKDRPVLDRRPAPWVLYGILAALAVFLVHNLIDFSLYENGPLMLFALLAGAALGVRGEAEPSAERPRMTFSVVALAAAGLAWLSALLAFVVPVGIAESNAQAGDDLFRAGRPVEAGTAYASAFTTAPVANADYAARAARAYAFAGPGDTAIEQKLRTLLEQAVAADPVDPSNYLLRARYNLASGGAANQDAIRHDFGRAIALNPNDVRVRLEYAQALERFGDREAALRQYQTVLKNNADLVRLRPDEPKQLTEKEKAEVADRIRSLGGTPAAQ
jgi:tetratricopeptide (TPR) repeat protein